LSLPSPLPLSPPLISFGLACFILEREREKKKRERRRGRREGEEREERGREYILGGREETDGDRLDYGYSNLLLLFLHPK